MLCARRLSAQSMCLALLISPIFPVVSCHSTPYGVQSVQRKASPDLCSIIDGRTAIVDNRLFILSANYTFDDDRGSNQAPFLYSINLNTTFSVDNHIPQSQLNAVSSPSDELLGISDGAGTFFYDHESLYAYAGIISPEKDSFTNSLWAFNTTSNAWNLTDIQGGNIQFNNNSEGEYASIPATGQSFYTGGFGIGINRTFAGIFEFDAYNTPSPSWSLQTQGPTGIAPPSVLKGGMAYIRRGKAGVMIVFGGFDTSHTGVEFAAGEGWDWDYWDMSQTFVYDIYSNAWYNVTATGDVPSHRGEFCIGVSSPSDDSSFQITVYGGWDQLAEQAFSDVYVLSIPGFRWIHIEDRNNPDRAGGLDIGRTRAKCNMWQDSQIVVTGGLVSDESGHLNLDACNSRYYPLKVLDTSTYVWQTQFEPDKKYSVPSVVSDVIGGDSSGSATTSSPAGSWPNADLSEIFSHKVARDTFSPPNSTSKNSSTPASSSPQPTPSAVPASKPLSTGIIVAIAIGSFILLVLSLFVVFCIFKRKWKAAPSQRPGFINRTKSTDSSKAASRSELPVGKPRLELTGNSRVHGELDHDGPARPHELGSRAKYELSSERL